MFSEDRELLRQKKSLTCIEELPSLIHQIAESLPEHPQYVLHRVVHGMEHESPMRITEETLKILEELTRINPLHNSIAFEGISLSLQLFGNSEHYAIFDTDFHRSIPEYARLYGVDYQLYSQGIKKYGFHGISYSYLLSKSEELLKKKSPSLIMMHLGQGCSVCAVKEGASVDTSMGFTPLEGLLMVSRPGDVDAGVLLYMLRSGMPVEELERKLYREAGIRAIAGVSSFEELMAMKKGGDERADLAFRAFLHRLVKYVGAYWFLLEGNVDALVFSGGIGENSPEVREELCRRLAFLGVRLDIDANRKSCKVISSEESTIKVLVLKTDEELQMVSILAEYLEGNKII
ncbi:MAG: acetate/propionate family kinase [Aquificaceae bacterium]|jgi:acetate kinase|uniref:acetate/propionate family kinase n=1 Tax=Hydrogenobacter sp. Uz 6-8 TaxID=3384828 RepID=UPI0030A54DB8